MDIAYDHLSSPIHTDSPSNPPSTDPSDPSSSSTATQLNNANNTTLPTEFQQAFQAVSASPWGAKLGGWFSSAVQQSSTLIQDAEREASKGWTSLAEQVGNRTRGMSLEGPIPGEEQLPIDGKEKEKNTDGEAEEGERPESLPADIVKEASTVFANLRVTAAAKLRDLAKAEDKADEALEKFGLGVRDFLRNAVVISSPDSDGEREVLFETQEAGTGKKVFHTTRLDAQLHAIHTTPASFLEEPKGGEWEGWRKEFDVDVQTEAIAKDLEGFPELRSTMEKLVPEKVEYKEFWERYYWLRKAVEEDERRRKEVLKGATTAPEEEISWDDDDEDEEDKSATPQNPTPSNDASASTAEKASQSTTTLNAPATTTTTTTTTTSSTLEAPRKSEDESRSVADSEASYDIVSGATSRATGSPKTKETKEVKVGGGKAEESDDDDWE